MKIPKVSFQGERGSFSEDAVFKFFRQADPLPYRTFSHAFQAVSSGETDYGVVPIENSQAGSINDTYDLLLAHDLNVFGEVYLKVVHCLLALPGETINDIKKIYSHPQAIAQCDEFLSSLKAEIIPTYDTAGSAKMIKEGGLRNCAAIASKRVSQIYGMDILAEGIQTNPRNFTRFFVISKEKAKAAKLNKTSLVFRTKNEPGTLYESLGVFAMRGINLTKLESRPAKDTPWEYVFYVDFEGHVDDEVCKEALKELRSKCAFLKILGSYARTQD
ncbi:MAG: prephenate dehydratase [Dehalococcoidia bacterium]|nr:prephenate dehydratase [Dehalococcoidia bacterium]